MLINFIPYKLAKHLKPHYKKSLNYAIIDGILWAMMFGLGENFLIPFALFFGASSFLVSLIPGIGQLSIAVSNLFSPAFINKFQKRKILIIITNEIHAFSWILILFSTLYFKNPIFIIIFYAFGVLSTSFAMTPWYSWMNDLIPVKIRGSYWGLKNKIVGFAQIGATLLGGFMLSLFKNSNNTLAGFSLIIVLSFLFRGFSFYPLLKQHEPKMKTTHKKQTSFFLFLKSLNKTNLGKFIIFNSLLTFASAMMFPFISVFLIKTLHFSYLQFSIIIFLGSFFMFLSMSYWGNLSDKYGNYKIIKITSIVVPFLTLGWVIFRNFYILLSLNAINGFFWAGFFLSTQNFIFDNSTKSKIHINMAYFFVFNNLFAFFGSITGGILTKIITKPFIQNILPFIKYTPQRLEIIFFISLILKTLTIIFFIKTFHEITTKPKIHNTFLVFIFKPAITYIKKIVHTNINKKIRKK